MSQAPTDAVAFYSAIAEDFHKSYGTDANRLERVAVWQRFFDKYARPGMIGYDIGCGSGILACELARRGVDTTGIDGASGMLELARRTAADAAIDNLTFQSHRLPILDVSAFRRANIIISSSAIEYLDSVHEALAFLRKLLQPGGIVIFSLSNRSSWSRTAVRMVHRATGYPRYLGLLKHFMTIEEIIYELKSAGLTYIEHRYFARADRINRVLGKLLPPRLSSNMIIVVASWLE